MAVQHNGVSLLKHDLLKEEAHSNIMHVAFISIYTLAGKLYNNICTHILLNNSKMRHICTASNPPLYPCML